MTRPRRPLDRHAAALVVVGALPAIACSLVLAWTFGLSAKALWTMALVVCGGCAVAAVVARAAVGRALQTASNLVASLREGDYSVRGRDATRADPLGELHAEVNALADALRAERLREVEASALLARLLDEIDVAVLGFDDSGLVRLANRIAERLLGVAAADLHGRSAAALGVSDLLEGAAPRVVDRTFAGGAGRFELRRAPFRRAGAAHVMVTLADVSRALRDEERAAWRRLVRVLSHEIVNSTAPIQSVAASLLDTLAGAPGGASSPDLRPGLELVARRAESLTRFISTYAHLAHLPPPVLTAVEVEPLVRRMASLERRVTVAIEPGPAAEVVADADQLEHALINLVQNAADAAGAGGSVAMGWRAGADHVELYVRDDGPGIGDTPNLFVPFYTTKPGGSGIGLALSRQIAEAHGGRLTLNDAPEGGCIARLWLPRGARTSHRISR